MKIKRTLFILIVSIKFVAFLSIDTRADIVLWAFNENVSQVAATDVIRDTRNQTARSGVLNGNASVDSAISQSSSMIWQSTGSQATVSIVQQMETFKPGWGSIFKSQFEIWVTPGSRIQLDFGGFRLLDARNIDLTFPEGAGLNPWTEIYNPPDFDPRFLRLFEGRDYYAVRIDNRALINTVFARMSNNPIPTARYSGSFDWRITDLNAVPEPSSMVLVFSTILVLSFRRTGLRERT